MEQGTLRLPYTKIKPLGQGGFGSACLIHHSLYGVIVLKTLSKTPIGQAEQQQLKQLKREADIQSKLRHPNVVVLYDAFLAHQTCGLFLEYMMHGAVDEFIKNFEVCLQWKIRVMHDVALGMCYLHQQGVIHGDLKSPNVLIGIDYHAKISDFGLSRTLNTPRSTKTNSVSGTVGYIAPEYLDNPRKRKNEKYDIYSYGIFSWELLSEKHAYYDFCDWRVIEVHVARGKRPRTSDIFEPISESDINLIRNCWDQQDVNRPTFRDVLEHLENSQQQFLRPVIEFIPKERTEENESFDEFILALSIEQCIAKFSKVRNSLVHSIDPDHGLLWCLNDEGVLTDSDLVQLDDFKLHKTKNFVDMNEELLYKYISPRINACCKEFLRALFENQQRHIAFQIMNKDNNLDERYRSLTQDEIYIINNNIFSLVNLLKSDGVEFLYRLMCCKCITERHKESIERWQDSKKKTDELMTILKRRSYGDFCNFKSCMRDMLNKTIIKVLEECRVTGLVKLLKRSDRKIIESKVIDLLIGFESERIEIDQNLTRDQIQIITDILKDLEIVGIHTIRNPAGRSRAACSQLEEIVSYKTPARFNDERTCKEAHVSTQSAFHAELNRYKPNTTPESSLNNPGGKTKRVLHRIPNLEKNSQQIRLDQILLTQEAKFTRLSANRMPRVCELPNSCSEKAVQPVPPMRLKHIRKKSEAEQTANRQPDAELVLTNELPIPPKRSKHMNKSLKSIIKGANLQLTTDETDPNAPHPNIFCNECKTIVKGVRYKCSFCFNVDLCSSCKPGAIHFNHNILTIKHPPEKLPDLCFDRWNRTGKQRFSLQELTDPTDDEYSTVVNNIATRGGQRWASRIKKICRIENVTLHDIYMSLKRELEDDNGKDFQNEMILWHGTRRDALANIYENGFNRTYCGKNATAYGHGVYFARNFSYSAHSDYSFPDTNGIKYIFQCRVLTGQFTKGSPGFEEPPLRNLDCRYDSCVDDIDNPSLFVIFKDMKVYPEYIICVY